jgi:hypothetical protein
LKAALILLEAGLCGIGFFFMIFISVDSSLKKLGTGSYRYRKAAVISIIIFLIFYIVPIYLGYNKIMDGDFTLISFFIPVFLFLIWVLKNGIGS